MELQAFLAALPGAAKSPLALAAYVVVATAWTVRFWFTSLPQRQIDTILKTYKDDSNRLMALRAILGNDVPTGTPRSDIIRIIRERGKEKSKAFLLAAYLSTVFAILIITAMAVYKASDTKLPPELVGSSVKRNHQ